MVGPKSVHLLVEIGSVQVQSSVGPMPLIGPDRDRTEVVHPCGVLKVKVGSEHIVSKVFVGNST
jgi:hypothetical protein